jgi:uncharacterized protein YjdB
MATIQLDLMAHLAGSGDVHKAAGEYAGTRGKEKPVEAFSLTLVPKNARLGLRYRATMHDGGATAWLQEGQLAGSRGNAAKLEGIQIELYGADLAAYDVQYMAHIANQGDTRWYANGEHCGTSGHTIEGLAVRIVPRQAHYVTLISQARSGSGKPLVITAPGRPDANVLVSAPTGDAHQQWDKRPVKAGQGYVLISKAWPDKCLARRDGAQAIVLKDAGTIDRDDTCIWLDDTVPGPYNAVRSWNNWELKLNMSGNPPYADRDNTLLAYPWAKGAPNELWQLARRDYNIVSGFDSHALNLVAAAIYRGCYPQVFRGSLPIGAGGLLSVGYDIAQAPVFHLEPDNGLRERLREAAALQLAAHDDATQLAAQLADGATVTATIQDLRLHVQLQGKEPAEVTAALTIGASIHAGADRSLRLHLTLGVLDIPGQPELEGVLKLLFVPLLLAVLNREILDRIRIPAIEFAGVGLTMPNLATRYPFALASSTRLPDLPVPPPEGRWPAQVVFAGVDAAILEDVGLSVLNTVAPHGEEGFDYGLSVKARYGVHFDALHFDVGAQSGNSYGMQIQARAGAGISGSFLGIPFSFGASAWGNVSARASIAVNGKGEVEVTLTRIDPVLLHWSFDGLPGFATAAIRSMLSAFTSLVASAVGRCLEGQKYKVFSVPAIEAEIAGKTFEIKLNNLKLDSMADHHGKPLVLASTVPEVKLVK